MELGIIMNDFTKVFDDEIGQRIKTLMRNFATEHYGDQIDGLEESLDRTRVIVGFARQAINDALEAEVSVMCFRNANGEEQIPTLFIGGVLHAQDVIQGKGSIVGKS
jgi:hypothetical protein